MIEKNEKQYHVGVSFPTISTNDSIDFVNWIENMSSEVICAENDIKNNNMGLGPDDLLIAAKGLNGLKELGRTIWIWSQSRQIKSNIHLRVKDKEFELEMMNIKNQEDIINRMIEVFHEE